MDARHRTLLELGNLVMEPSAVKSGGPLFEGALDFLAHDVT